MATNTPLATSRKYKVVIVGNGSSGKTTFIRRHISGEYQRDYIPTLGVEIRPLRFFTNKGWVEMNIWDCAGQEKFGGLRDGYYLAADAAILFAPVGRDQKASRQYLEEIRNIAGDIPVVVCHSSCDVPEVKRKYYRETPRYKDVLAQWHISSRSNYAIEKPFLHLFRHLLADPSLHLLEEPSTIPPEVDLYQPDGDTPDSPRSRM